MSFAEHLNQSAATSSPNSFIPWVALLLALTLSGCEESEPTSEIARLIAYNHTENYIHQYYVNDSGGGNSYAYGGGGGIVCCIGYPTTWYQGLSATVRWTTSTSIRNGPPGVTWHEKEVPIDAYEKPGSALNVHFLPDNQVRLVISTLGPRHPDYPGPSRPVKPADWPY